MNLLEQLGPDGDPRRYDLLLDMADLMVLHLTVPELLAELSLRLHKAISFEIANFSLHDPIKRVMRVHQWEGHDVTFPSEVPIDDSASGWVWQNQTSLVMGDIETESRFPLVTTVLRQKGIRSYCMLPLTTAQTRFGAIGLGSSRMDAYKEIDLRLLEGIAKLVALTLENSFDREILMREKMALSTLLDLNATLTSSLSLPQLFPVIAGFLERIVNQQHVSVALNEADSLQMYSLDRTSSQANTGLAVKDCAAYKVFEEGQPRIFRRPELEEIKSEVTGGLVAAGIRSLFCIPLHTVRGPIGTLNVGSDQEEAFDSIDVVILKQVAAQLAVALDNARAYREIQELKDKLAEEKLYLEDEIRSEFNFEEIIGDSAALKNALLQAKTVAPSGATTLILGETGTGKELIARAIHRMSSRKDNNFIKLNCAAIPTGLLESELFGHEKGAFTGAINQKVGRLELADKGTLFLDEIGDIPPELQPKLLRVLQDQEFERLGGNRTIKVDVRVIAATNRDLAKLVAAHEFRSDLYYRLNVFPIVLPPLRERGEDLPQLVRYFVQKLSKRMDKKIDSIPTATMKALRSWSWPGNVRELENFLERSVILTSGPALRAPLAELRLAGADGYEEGTLREVERRHIVRVLKETRGVIAGSRGAAVKLGVKRTTLQSRMQKLKIDRREYLS